MLNLDPAKLLIIFVVALVVLGPERLPKVARQVAGFWREFARIRDQVTEEVRAAIPEVNIPRLPNTHSAINGLLNGITGAGRPASGTQPQGSVAAGSEGGAPGEGGPPEGPGARVPPSVVVHPTLGDVAFLPDDPSMN